jgi:hypothetical protein
MFSEEIKAQNSSWLAVTMRRGKIMDWKDEVRPTLAWADGYEEAEDYEDASRDEDDETIQSLTTAHDLWMAMLKSWVEAEA